MVSDAPVKLRCARACTAAIAAATALWLGPTSGGSARAEPRDNNPAGGIDLGRRIRVRRPGT